MNRMQDLFFHIKDGSISVTDKGILRFTAIGHDAVVARQALDQAGLFFRLNRSTDNLGPKDEVEFSASPAP